MPTEYTNMDLLAECDQLHIPHPQILRSYVSFETCVVCQHRGVGLHGITKLPLCPMWACCDRPQCKHMVSSWVSYFHRRVAGEPSTTEEQRAIQVEIGPYIRDRLLQEWNVQCAKVDKIEAEYKRICQVLDQPTVVENIIRFSETYRIPVDRS